MSIVLTRSLVLAPGELPYDVRRFDAPVIGWQNLVRLGGIEADLEDVAYTADNLANPATHLFWRSSAATTQQIRFVFDDISTIDYIGLAKHNLGTVRAAVSFAYRTGADDTWLPLTSDFILGNDNPAIIRFEGREAAEVLMTITNPEGIPQIAVIYLGKLLQLQRKIYVGHTPINYGRSTKSTTGRSESGNFLGRVITGRSKQSAISLQNLTPDWYRARMEPFVDHAEELPFFFAWRPDNYPREVGYCWTTSDIIPSNQRPNGMMQVDFNIAGIAGDGLTVVIE